MSQICRRNLLMSFNGAVVRQYTLDRLTVPLTRGA